MADDRTTSESPARDPREKFVQLANKRVNKAIKDLRLVANLSNRGSYSYDEAQVRKIIRALKKEVENVKARFTNDSDTGDDIFRL